MFKKTSKAIGFTQGELIVIYIMLVTSVTICGDDMMQNLFDYIGHAHWFATPANKWADLFHQYIPKWLVVSNEKALENFYIGNANLYLIDNFKIWLIPLAAWSALILTFIFMMLCINVLIRKQWTENEKLSYPIIQLPFAISREGGNIYFLKNKLMWIGFAIPFFIDTINGLHQLYPVIPELPVSAWNPTLNLHEYIRTRPWNVIGWTPLAMYLFTLDWPTSYY